MRSPRLTIAGAQQERLPYDAPRGGVLDISGYNSEAVDQVFLPLSKITCLMKSIFAALLLLISGNSFGSRNSFGGEIGVISLEEAKQLIQIQDAAKKPIVLDTRGGYKDYFRGHLLTAHHLNFDTLRGTDQGVPVQYLPDDLSKALLVRAGVDKKRTHLIYATGDKLPNDEILSASMVA